LRNYQQGRVVFFKIMVFSISCALVTLALSSHDRFRTHFKFALAQKKQFLENTQQITAKRAHVQV